MKKSIKRIAIILFASTFLALSATGCGTVKGFGSDVEKTGNKIERAANG